MSEADAGLISAMALDGTARRPVLEVSRLRLGYGDLIAVWDVSLRLLAGQTTALVGRNGAGKTTLLSGIAGILPVKAGNVVLGGHDITKVPSYRRVQHGLGLVQEGKRVFRRLTVRDNLMLGLRACGVRKSQMSGRLDRLYTDFGMLGERAHTLAGSLSGGQQQMLAIATALASEPRVLLVDEPSSGLAPVFVDQVFEILEKLRDSGMAILLVEQLVEEVLDGIADDVVVLEQGRVTVADKAVNLSAEAIARGIYAAADDGAAG
jgi:branched-chain amino acid transport system ATP-binding protein